MSEEMDGEMVTEESKQNKGMKAFWKVVLGILIALVGLVGLVLAWAFFSYPAEYLIRSIRWGDSDVYDYQKFPARPVAAGPTPFYFKEEPAEAMVQKLFEQHPIIDDLDEFLEGTQTQPFIVIKDDAILYEKYFNGASRDTIVTSFSVAKAWNSPLSSSLSSTGRRTSRGSMIGSCSRIHNPASQGTRHDWPGV